MKNIIQISDCHIDDKTHPMGVDTNKNLLNVIRNIKNIPADALLITGDLSHSGTTKSYEIIKKYLSILDTNYIVLPGNHDNIKNINKEFSDNILREYSIGDWCIISAYSKKNGQVSGYLSTDELSQLEDAINFSNSKHIIVIIHHPPIPMNSDWDDSLSLENMDDFFTIINKYSNIKAILWGHAHQSSEFNHNQVKLISCPSTAIQFDNEQRIGFNHFSLHDDGNIEYKTIWL